MSDTFTGETYDTLCSDAEDFLAKGSPEQSRELLLKAISLIGTRPRARSLLADTCMSIGLWTEARSQLEILITLEEGNINNNFRLAQVLEELGEYQLAYDNYSVVLEKDSNHHSAGVALQRIEARSKESGINLAGVFGSSASEPSEENEPPDVPETDSSTVNEGMQVFPDVPGESVFAESDDEDENSIEKLLKNIGITSDGSSEDSDDISKLLRNIGVSSPVSAESDEETGEDSKIDEEKPEKSSTSSLPPDLQAIFASTSSSGEKPSDTDEKKDAVPSLDDIFGTPSRSSIAGDSQEEAVETPPETAVEEETEVSDESAPQLEQKKETDDSLQAIFSSAEPTEHHDSGEVDAEMKESLESMEVIIGKSAEEGSEEEPPEDEGPPAEEESPEDAAEEEQPSQEVVAEETAIEEEQPPQEVVAEETAIEEEQPPQEVVAEEKTIEEEQPPQEVAAEETAIEEEQPPQEEVAEEKTIEEELPAESKVLELSIDNWSSESGLFTAHLSSGSIRIPQSLLTVFEDTLDVQCSKKGLCTISGKGTFLLNCGPYEPLILDFKENMTIRLDAMIFEIEALTHRPLFTKGASSLVVLEGKKFPVKGVFKAGSPVRIILLGRNSRTYFVKTESIIAADPGIAISDKAPKKYSLISGEGKVYLVE